MYNAISRDIFAQRAALALAGLLSLSCSPAALAQVNPTITSPSVTITPGNRIGPSGTIPAQTDPAQVEKRFDRDNSAQLPPSRVIAPVQAPPQIPADVQARMAQQRFVLKNVAVEGSTVYKKDELAAAYKDQLGKEMSLLDAQGIAQRITTQYRSDGYILSQAVVASPDTTGGTLRVRVIEGYISDVKIEGDIHEVSWRPLINSYAENIKKERPIRVADLERYLLLMNDLPGSSAKGVVRPSATPGTAELVVTFDYKRFEGSYTLDNRGTKFVGPWEHTGTFAANSLFGLHDRTLLRVITTAPVEELKFYDIQHEEQLDSEGTRLVLDASHSRTLPGDVLTPLGIVGNSYFLQARVLHPFIRSRQENLVGRFTFDSRDTYTDVFKEVPFTDDRLRVARLGGNYDFADGLYGVNLIDTQVSRGTNWFGATGGGSNRSNPNGDADFTKFNLDLTRTQPLPSDFSLFFAASGQYSLNPLLIAEQFTLGGVGFGQAYDPAELAGDHGLAGHFELRYGRTIGDYYLNSYQLYTYYDIGRVWSRGVGPGFNDKRSLASFGTGLRTNFTDNLYGNLEWAIPLTKPLANEPEHGNSPRVFFSATARF